MILKYDILCTTVSLSPSLLFIFDLRNWFLNWSNMSLITFMRQTQQWIVNSNEHWDKDNEELVALLTHRQTTGGNKISKIDNKAELKGLCTLCSSVHIQEFAFRKFCNQVVWLLNLHRRWWREGAYVCLVSLSTSISSGVWSRPQHPGWTIGLIDSWVPPVPHCDDLSPPKLWPLVACVWMKI